MQTEQFQLHAAIEERHWWFVARRRIVRALIDQTLHGQPTGDRRPSPRPDPNRLSAGSADNANDRQQCETTRASRPLVIDVGCGTGANIASLSDGYRCVGIDTSAEAIELARQRFAAVEFIHGFAPHDLGGHMADAQMITMMDVLEHVPDDFALLSSLLSATRPGTYVLLTVPADLSLWSEHDESFGHYRRYDRARFERIWAGLPVTPMLVSHYNARLFPLIKAVRSWNRRRGRSGGVHGTDFNIPAAPVNRSFETIFAGERRILGQVLEGRRISGYRTGVSLIAILRRDEGAIDVRSKPNDVAPDYFDPSSRLV